MAFAKQSQSGTSGIRAARMAAVTAGAGQAAAPTSGPAVRQNRSPKPVDKAIAQKRRRIIIGVLALGVAYIGVMEPKQVEVMTHKFGMIDIGFGVTTPKAATLGALTDGPLVAMPAMSAAGSIKTGAASGGSGNGNVRLGIDTFWAKQRVPATGETDFAVKAELSLSNGPLETIWVRGVTRDGNTVTGVLASSPVALKGLREGAKVAFDASRISGWRFKANCAVIASDARP